MPESGAQSPHECADCGEPMYWTESAVRNPDLLARTAPGSARAAHVDAYRCRNGHTSKECPVCGSYDTGAWADPDGAALVRLSEAGIVASGRAGRARVAFHVFNDGEDVDLAARALGR